MECRDKPRGWLLAGKAACLIAAMLFLCGMGRKADNPPPVFSIHTLLFGSYMAADDRIEPSAEWIRSREALQKIFSDAGSHKLSISAPEAMPEVDLAACRVLLVRMGRKPTAGYRLRCLPERSGLSGDVAVIALEWSDPPPGQVAAQVVTNPFVLLQISNAGYKQVKLVDQDEQTRFELTVDD